MCQKLHFVSCRYQQKTTYFQNTAGSAQNGNYTRCCNNTKIVSVVYLVPIQFCVPEQSRHKQE